MTTKTPDAWRAAVAAGLTEQGYWSWEPPVPKSTELRPFYAYFDRDVVQVDRLSRIIYARSFQEAEALAGQAAEDFDSDCPDDVETGTGGVGFWDSSVSSSPPTAELATIPVWAPADA